MIAFFGMGLLGSNFVRALRRRGEDVHVWNRSPEKATALEAEGARAFTDPAEAARGAARVHLTLPDDAVVDDVLERARPGITASTVIVDHSTTSTKGALARIARWREHGIAFVPAPVFMGPQNARDSTGIMMVSGPRNVVEPVKPVIVPTNEPFFALTRTAKTIGAQELIMGPSNKYRPEDQLDAVALYWLNVCGAKPEPLSIRVLGKDRDMRLDIAGGSQIPKPGAAGAESAGLLADLRKSWHGVERLLLAYDGSPLSADFLDTVMSFLDPAIQVTLIDVALEDPDGEGPADPITEANEVIERGVERARELGRIVTYKVARGQAGPEIVQEAVEGKFDAIFMSLRGVYLRGDTTAFASNTRYVLENAPCRVILGFAPKSIPSQTSSNGTSNGA